MKLTIEIKPAFEQPATDQAFQKKALGDRVEQLVYMAANALDRQSRDISKNAALNPLTVTFNPARDDIEGSCVIEH